MTHHSALRRILALTALAAIAAGCGASPAPSAPIAPRYAPLQAQAPQQQQPPEATEIFPFLADIGLTAGEKREIRSLLEQQEAPVSPDEAQQRGERFLELLASRTLDQEALEAFFTTSAVETRQQTTATVRLFTGIRDTGCGARSTARADFTICHKLITIPLDGGLWTLRYARPAANT